MLSKSNVTLDEDKLAKALDRAFDDLQKQGYLKGITNEDDKFQLIKDVFTHIKEASGGVIPEITLTTQNAEAFGKKLQESLVTEYFSQQFEKLPEMKPEQKNELTDELRDVLKKGVKKANQLEPEPKPEAELDSLVEQLLQLFMKKFQANQTWNKNAMDLRPLNKPTGKEEAKEDDELSPEKTALRSLYGGMDPTQPSMQMVVEFIAGNTESFQSEDTNPESGSYMAEENTYNPKITDDTGKEARTLMLLVALGIDVEYLMDDLVMDHLAPNMSSAPKLEPGAQ